jgi:DNA polymerase III epsilon subunit-like protein
MKRIETLSELELLVNGMNLATSLGYHRKAEPEYKELTIVVDLETSGFIVGFGNKPSCQALQLAARVLQTLPAADKIGFNEYIKLEADKYIICKDAMAAHGIDVEILKKAEPWATVMSKLWEWIQGLYDRWKPETVTLIGYSSSHFDSRFIIKGATEAKLDIPPYLQFADAYHILQQWVPEKFPDRMKRKLATVFTEFVGYEVNPKLLHEAWPDTLVLTAILLAANAIARVDSRSPLVALLKASHLNPGVQSLLKK